MKARWRLTALVLIIVLIISGCNFLKEDDHLSVFQIGEIGERNSYTIHCILDTENMTLSANEKLRYYNSSNLSMNEIYFHIYPNAFKRKETAPFLFDDFEGAYKGGFEPGYIEVLSISSEDERGERSLEYSFSGEGETILKVDLGYPLKPYKKIDLEFNFKLQIPPANERFGYSERNVNLGNWYPIAAVYDEKNGWNLDKYYAIGDPFYSSIADYNVSIKAPKDYIIASSGNFIDKKSEGDMIIWSFEEKALRDFAFVACKDFDVKKKKVDGTIIKSYFYKKDEERGKEALEWGAKAIEVFNKLYGKYPYGEFSIVGTEFPSGMEYPMLIYISDKYYKPSYPVDALIITIVHEVAHQWFYGIVGNDQIDEPWLDEGFASYSETLFAEEVLGKREGEDYYMRTVERNIEEALNNEIIDGSLSKSLPEFENWEDYGPTAYGRGAQMLHELRRLLGDDKFFEIIKNYVEEYRFKIATGEDFIKVCQEVSDIDLGDFFEPWLGK